MARVLVTAETLSHGGMEHIACELALGLAARGHKLCVAGIYGGGPLEERLRAKGLEVHAGLGPARPSLSTARRLRRLARGGGFRLVVAGAAGGIFTPFATLWACHPLGIPCVRWMHSTPAEPLKGPAAWAQNWMTRTGVTVVASTQAHVQALERFWGIPRRQMVVIPNGLPLPAGPAPADRAQVRAELGIPAEAFVVGIVAGFRACKRHEVLVRAMRLVGEQVPQAHLLAVGDGILRPATQALAAELGIEPQATFTGTYPDALRAYAAMDVHVLCSYPAETFPLVLIEAMNAGVTPVCTRVGGLPEIIQDGLTGVLVEPESPDALAAAIVDLARNPARRLRIAQAAQRCAQARFTVDAMVEGFVKLGKALSCEL